MPVNGPHKDPSGSSRTEEENRGGRRKLQFLSPTTAAEAVEVGVGWVGGGIKSTYLFFIFFIFIGRVALKVALIINAEGREGGGVAAPAQVA